MRLAPVYILDALRTPIGKHHGVFDTVTAVELGAHAIRSVLKRAHIPGNHVDEVIMGQVIQAGAGPNPARQAALRAGLPETVAAFTVNKACGSGLKAVLLASQAIRAGEGDLFVAGGMESMSRTPLLLEKPFKAKKAPTESTDSILTDGLLCPFCRWHTGNAAEFIAKKYKISRVAQDRFALESHRKAVRAQQQGLFDKEIVPVRVGQGSKRVRITRDEAPRPNTSMEALEKLPTVFQKKGTVTPGNAPGLNDGAAALLVCSKRYLNGTKIRPLAKILDYVTIGTAPSMLFAAPALAAMALRKKMKASWKDFHLMEVNEAFSAASLASEKIAGWNPQCVNVHGGAVALGHPIGASGARILTTLLYAMAHRKAARGMVSICMGGGNGMAVAVERLS